MLAFYIKCAVVGLNNIGGDVAKKSWLKFWENSARNKEVRVEVFGVSSKEVSMQTKYTAVKTNIKFSSEILAKRWLRDKRVFSRSFNSFEVIKVIETVVFSEGERIKSINTNFYRIGKRKF